MRETVRERYKSADILVEKDHELEAWAAALLAASKDPALVEAFQKETGITYTAPKSSIEAMIDDASGRNESIAHEFGKWFNEKVWGPWEGEG